MLSYHCRARNNATICRRGSGYVYERFQEKGLDCCNQMEKEVLVDICFHSMMEECIIFLENLSFLSYSKLMEAARNTNELVRRTSRSSSTTRPSHPPMVRPSSRKRLIVRALNNKGKEAGLSSLKRRPFDKRTPRST